jgi:hypothetical protein
VHITYPTSAGRPLGFPIPDKSARALEQLIKSLPKTDEFAYRHLVVGKATSEVNAGERSDVSWISTEAPDLCQEVVIARGMNDSQFAANPLVTLQHQYWCPPVGHTLWRKRVKDGDRVGIKAKTVYPPKPANWPAADDQPWAPDKVLSLIQAGMLNGKSIGFLPLKCHTPESQEYAKAGWEPGGVKYVIDEWLLLEYAVCFIPMNSEALVEAVSKGTVDLPADLAKALGIDDALFRRPPNEPQVSGSAVPFTPLTEVEKAVNVAISGIDFEGMARRAAEWAWERKRGRV